MQQKLERFDPVWTHKSIELNGWLFGITYIKMCRLAVLLATYHWKFKTLETAFGDNKPFEIHISIVETNIFDTIR